MLLPIRIKWRPHRLEIFVVLAIITGLWIVLFVRFRAIKHGELCQSNLRQVGLAMMQYARNYDEKYPPANRWVEVLHPYTKNNSIFQCPVTRQYGYSMNSHLNELSVAKVESPGEMPWVFESSTLQDSQHDKGESRLTEPRHPQGIGIAFGDGHAEWRQQLPQIRSFEPTKSKATSSR